MARVRVRTATRNCTKLYDLQSVVVTITRRMADAPELTAHEGPENTLGGMRDVLESGFECPASIDRCTTVVRRAQVGSETSAICDFQCADARTKCIKLYFCLLW